MKELIQCIYCKETKPSSREHVLQKSLGGNLVEKFVCEDCNQSFSSIDQALTEFSLISLSRVVNQSTDSNVKLGGEHFIKSEDGYHYEVEMRGGLKPLYKPQLGLIFNDNQIEIKTIASSKEDILLLYKTLKQHIVNNTVDKIHIKNNPKNSDEKGFIPRLVLHRKKTLYFQTCKPKSEAKKLLNIFFEKITPKIDTFIDLVSNNDRIQIQTIDKPCVSMHMSFKFNDIYRAIAKTMFNMLAHAEGTELVLRQEFDDIRNYIIGTDIRSQQLTPDAIACDHRFVQMLDTESSKKLRWVNNSKTHNAMLTYHAPAIEGAIDFYSSNIYLVHLGNITIGKNILHFFSFDYENKINYQTDLLEVYNTLKTK